MNLSRSSSRNIAASISFVRSPIESVENFLCSVSSPSPSLVVSRISSHSSCEPISSLIASTASASSSTWYGKYLNSADEIMLFPASSSPESSFRSVVFPFPLRPVRPSRQFVSSLNETLSNTLSPPSYAKVRFLISIIDIKISPLSRKKERGAENIRKAKSEGMPEATFSRKNPPATGRADKRAKRPSQRFLQKTITYCTFPHLRKICYLDSITPRAVCQGNERLKTFFTDRTARQTISPCIRSHPVSAPSA